MEYYSKKSYQTPQLLGSLYSSKIELSLSIFGTKTNIPEEILFEPSIDRSKITCLKTHNNIYFIQITDFQQYSLLCTIFLQEINCIKGNININDLDTYFSIIKKYFNLRKWFPIWKINIFPENWDDYLNQLQTNYSIIMKESKNKYVKGLFLYSFHNDKKKRKRMLLNTKEFFDLRDFYGYYQTPWFVNSLQYDRTIVNQILKLTLQTILNIIKEYTSGFVCDLACGSGGRYSDIMIQKSTGYLGIDIDISLLQLAYDKINRKKNDLPLYTIPLDLSGSCTWNSQIKSYFNGMKGILNQQFDTFLSIYGIQYSNQSPEYFKMFYKDISIRSKCGTKMIVFFPDGDKIGYETKEFYCRTGNHFHVKLPHRPPHDEPIISMTDICNTFNDWTIIHNGSFLIEESKEILDAVRDYISIMSYLILQKN
jgi:hypothetical protein